MVEYFRAKGGELQYNARLQEIQLGEDGNVTGFQLADGSTVTGDLYVSAMPGGLRISLCVHSLWPYPACSREPLLIIWSSFTWRLLTALQKKHRAPLAADLQLLYSMSE